MNKVNEFFKTLSGSELPAVKVGIDPNTLINLGLTIVLAVGTILLMYTIIHRNK